MARKNALNAALQLFKVVVDCGDDDRDVLRGQRWLGGKLDGFVEPVTETVDNGAEVPMRPINMRLAFVLFYILPDLPAQTLGPRSVLWSATEEGKALPEEKPGPLSQGENIENRHYVGRPRRRLGSVMNDG